MDSWVFVVIGLLLQAAALVLLFARLKGRWFTHVGAVFVVLAVAYHGLGEILLWIFPGRDYVRRLVSPDYVSQFVLWVSLGILLFTLAYLRVLRPARETKTVDAVWSLARMRRVFDWRLLLVALAPLLLLTVAGNSTVQGQAMDFSQGVAFQFFLLVAPLASFAIILRFGRRLFLPVLFTQSLVIALIGQRLEILVAAALLVYTLTRVGITVRRRHLAITGIAFIFVALIITSARGAEGHLAATAGGSLRLEHLVTGLGNLGSATTWDQLAADLGYRLDGNSFGAMELESLSTWRLPTLGPQPLVNDLLLAIPSFLNPAKTDSVVENRSEKAYAEMNLMLPLIALTQDILPTQLGVFIGMAGPWGLLLVALLLGAGFGFADRWLRRLTPSRLLIGVALLTCVLFYERSWETYSIILRGIVVLLPCLWLLQGIRTGSKAPRRFRSPTPRLKPASIR